MAGITQPYMFDPKGDGVRYPIRQTALWNPGGLLPPGIASKLWARRGAAPNVYAWTIKSNPITSEVVPSNFSQYGRGRVDPLRLGRKKMKGKRKIGGFNERIRSVINPGSF